MAENDSKKKSEMVETPVNTEGETLIDSPEKLLPEEWIYWWPSYLLMWMNRIK